MDRTRGPAIGGFNVTLLGGNLDALSTSAHLYDVRGFVRLHCVTGVRYFAVLVLNRDQVQLRLERSGNSVHAPLTEFNNTQATFSVPLWPFGSGNARITFLDDNVAVTRLSVTHHPLVVTFVPAADSTLRFETVATHVTPAKVAATGGEALFVHGAGFAPDVEYAGGVSALLCSSIPP